MQNSARDCIAIIRPIKSFNSLIHSVWKTVEKHWGQSVFAQPLLCTSPSVHWREPFIHKCERLCRCQNLSKGGKKRKVNGVSLDGKTKRFTSRHYCSSSEAQQLGCSWTGWPQVPVLPAGFLRNQRSTEATAKNMNLIKFLEITICVQMRVRCRFWSRKFRTQTLPTTGSPTVVPGKHLMSVFFYCDPVCFASWPCMYILQISPVVGSIKVFCSIFLLIYMLINFDVCVRVCVFSLQKLSSEILGGEQHVSHM